MQFPPLRQLLLIDIETVSQFSTFTQLPPAWQDLWASKVAWQLPDGQDAASFYTERAPILAEFGKIVCISAGYFREEGGKWQLRVRSFFGHDEASLLDEFVQSIGQFADSKRPPIWFAGHNIREFDMPYISRRLLIQGKAIPSWMNFQAMKPWDTPLLDTLQLWKFGDHKHYTSLALLAACLGIPSPKTAMDGSKVGQAYWAQNDLDGIAAYCQQDVVTVAQVLLKMQGMPLLDPVQIDCPV